MPFADHVIAPCEIILMKNRGLSASPSEVIECGRKEIVAFQYATRNKEKHIISPERRSVCGTTSGMLLQRCRRWNGRRQTRTEGQPFHSNPCGNRLRQCNFRHRTTAWHTELASHWLGVVVQFFSTQPTIYCGCGTRYSTGFAVGNSAWSSSERRMSKVVGLCLGWPIPKQPLRLQATSATTIDITLVFTSHLRVESEGTRESNSRSLSESIPQIPQRLIDELSTHRSCDDSQKCDLGRIAQKISVRKMGNWAKRRRTRAVPHLPRKSDSPFRRLTSSNSHARPCLEL